MKKRISFQKVRYEEKIRKILVSAEKLFAKKGYENASIDEIAAKLKLTKGSLYHYIKSKEDLLFEILLDATKRARESLDEVISSDRDTLEKLREAIRRYAKEATREDVIGAMRQQELVFHPNLRKQIIAERDKYQEAFLSIIQDGVEAGLFEKRNWNIKAFAAIGAVNHITRWYSPHGRLSVEEIGNIMADFIVKGLAAKK